MGMTIKKQFHILWREWVIVGAMILGGFVFGIGLHTLILRLDDTVESYFPMGSIMGIIMSAMYCAILIVVQIRQYFNMEISMGCTRKRFFVSYYAVCLAVDLIYPFILAALSAVENALNRAWYPHLTGEFDLVPYILKWGVPVAVGVTLVAGFCGVLMLRFGRTAFWILWAIWMILAIGIPQIHTAMEEAPSSLFGRVGSSAAALLGGLPGSVRVGGLAVIGLVCFAGTWGFVRRQQVVS